jgi:feruloyl-CoA synthase
MANLRSVKMNWANATMRHGDNGVLYITNDAPLPDYPRALFDKFDEWAEKTPDAIALADRRADSGWRSLTYRQIRDQSRAIGQYLLNKGLSAEHGLAIMAPNSVDHALMALGAMRAGVPYAAIAPAYALLSTDYVKLSYVLELMSPSMIFVDDTQPFKQALDAVEIDCLLMAVDNAENGFSLADALKTTPGESLAAAEASITADTIAKLLFTSGSTGMPKGVINTQRMLCSNQEMIRQSMAFIQDEPPILVDWLPWNHTAGGNHNFGLTLYNGGTLYIDEGKPTPDLMKFSVKNLCDIAPTLYFNVPKGFELLVHEMDENPELREKFFSRMKLIQYSGAGLSPHVFKRLEEMSIETVGEETLIITGYGATETAPFATCPIGPMRKPGLVGLPAVGVEFKLVPHDVKTELRVRGPSITPGYWGEPDKTEEAFDDEGFYCIKDAIKLADPEDISKGLMYNGRLAEDFKLSTGTWVNFANLRAGFIKHATPIVRELVLTGHDLDFIGALLFLDVEQARKIDSSLANASTEELAKNHFIREHIQRALNEYKEVATGSSTRISRVMIMGEEASIQTGEMTDKGSVNQRSVLTRRAELVNALYEEQPGPDVLIAQ